MKTYSVREVIEMALQTEKLGHQLYSELARKFMELEPMQELFAMLAREELQHEAVFSDLLARAGDEEPEHWEEAQPYFRAIVESEFFLGGGKSLPSLSGARTPGEALDFAIGFEKETALFFHGLLLAVREKGPVEAILKEEARHLSRLTAYRESLRG